MPWSTGPAPAWIADAQPLPNAASDVAPDSPSGQRYLLYAREVKVASAQWFVHTARLITNETGLQANSQLNIDFDPTYQSLTLHYVRIKRGSKVVNVLDPKEVKLVQREPDLESQVYDSRQSAVLFLPDLRVGDTVDAAYTLTGADPTLEGVYDDQVWLGAPAPIDRLFVRILTPATPRLSVTLYGPDSSQDPQRKPEISPDHREYRWDLRGTPAYLLEAGTPGWFDPLPVAMITAFGSWRDVVQWGRRLFEPVPALRGEALSWVKQARADSPTDGTFAVRAARFVQDQIRYVGLEVGLSRRKPGDPQLTFQRRYGDCKDKTALLVALLRAAGMQAYAVLASSRRGPALAASPPSPSVFDHALVTTVVDGRPYYIDPTVMLRGGGLDRYAFSSLGYVLELSPDTVGLRLLRPEPQDDALLDVADTLELPTPGSPTEARLVSRRVYRRSLADQMRVQLRAKSSEQVAKHYLDIYEPVAPGIHALEAIAPNDERDADRLSVTLRLGVPKPWKLNEALGQYASSVVLDACKWALARPDSGARRSALAVPYPFRCRHVMNIDLPFDLPALTSGPVHLATASTGFDFTAHYRDRRLTYQTDVSTFAAAVAAAEMTEQVTLVDQARELMQRAITRNAGLAEAGARGINWLMAALLLLVAAGSGWLSLRAFRWERSLTNTRLGRGQPAPFGGWLLLLGMNVLIYPIVLVMGQLSGLGILLSAARWQALATPGLVSFRPGLSVLLVLEGSSMLLLLGYSLTVAASLFYKLRSFPWHFSGMMIGSCVFQLLDLVAVSFVSDTAQTSGNWLSLLRTLAFSVIWLSYVRQSSRVARTFTRRARRRVRRPKAGLVQGEA